MLKEAKRHIKKMIYSLKWASTSVNMTDLVPIEKQSVDLVENVPVVFRITCEGKFMPCELHFDYLTQGDLKLYTSFSNMQPDRSNHDDMREGRPKTFKIFDQSVHQTTLGKHMFQQQNIYLTLVSLTGVEIVVSYNFGILN